MRASNLCGGRLLRIAGDLTPAYRFDYFAVTLVKRVRPEGFYISVMAGQLLQVIEEGSNDLARFRNTLLGGKLRL